MFGFSLTTTLLPWPNLGYRVASRYLELSDHLISTCQPFRRAGCRESTWSPSCGPYFLGYCEEQLAVEWQNGAKGGEHCEENGAD